MNGNFYRKSNPIATVFWLIVLVVGVVFFLYMLIQAIVQEENNKRIYKAHYSQQEQHYIRVFKKYGSPEPEAMACAVTKTKNPKLMAAMAVVESNGNHRAVGDSGASKGAFQVQAKHWGEVPSTATEQAQQAERILEELVASSRGSLLKGLSKYNGRGQQAKRYADKVLGLRGRV